MQDMIERKITIQATQSQIYAAIADPKQIISWFPRAVEGKFAVGEKPVLDFGEHKTQIYIVAMQPIDYFAYRWVPGGNTFKGDIQDAPTTLVEFRITESDSVSTVTLTESGFAQLPPEMAEASFAQNSGGWDYGLTFLEKLFAKN